MKVQTIGGEGAVLNRRRLCRMEDGNDDRMDKYCKRKTGEKE
jgi:hypothetical protein